MKKTLVLSFLTLLFFLFYCGTSPENNPTINDERPDLIGKWDFLEIRCHLETTLADSVEKNIQNYIYNKELYRFDSLYLKKNTGMEFIDHQIVKFIYSSTMSFRVVYHVTDKDSIQFANAEKNSFQIVDDTLFITRDSRGYYIDDSMNDEFQKIDVSEIFVRHQEE